MSHWHQGLPRQAQAVAESQRPCSAAFVSRSDVAELRLVHSDHLSSERGSEASTARNPKSFNMLEPEFVPSCPVFKPYVGTSSRTIVMFWYLNSTTSWELCAPLMRLMQGWVRFSSSL